MGSNVIRKGRGGEVEKLELELELGSTKVKWELGLTSSVPWWWWGSLIALLSRPRPLTNKAS